MGLKPIHIVKWIVLDELSDWRVCIEVEGTSKIENQIFDMSC